MNKLRAFFGGEFGWLEAAICVFFVFYAAAVLEFALAQRELERALDALTASACESLMENLNERRDHPFPDNCFSRGVQAVIIADSKK
jgi:hypothetical protein